MIKPRLRPCLISTRCAVVHIHSANLTMCVLLVGGLMNSIIAKDLLIRMFTAQMLHKYISAAAKANKKVVI